MRKGPIIVAVAVILSWWGISMTRSLSTDDGSFKPPIADGEEGMTAAKIAIPSGDLALNPVTVTSAPAPAVKPEPAFEFQSELNSYAQLKTKVLPSPEEQAARESLLKNPFLLRSIGSRLMRLPLMALGEQDVAIDLLVEALERGEKTVAEEAMVAIVADGQVEDTKLATPVREQLAGIKAEVLYHWTAFQPDQAGRMGSLLPGPTSRKIWDNVVNAHKANLEESAAEANR